MIKDKIKEDNYKIFALVSNYLNKAADFIRKEAIEEIIKCGVDQEYAFAVLLATAFGLDPVDRVDDKNFFHHYFSSMIHQLKANEYQNNLYYKNIKIPKIRIGDSELTHEKYQPFEGFVCNEILQTEEGRQIPQIGFFETEFEFPVVLEKDRLWMSITPNEIETMKEPVKQAFGKVLTFGLGLGYFAYMASQKNKVKSITIVESNENVIALFIEYLLPQFAHAQKVEVIKADAFEYAQKFMSKGQFDFVFTDLWHDVGDGIDLYLKMKQYEKHTPGTVFAYWIEKSILCYL